MKKLLSCLLIACLCMTILAACGGNQTNNNSGNTTGTTTEPTQETTQEATQETTTGSGSGPDFEINFDDLLPKN